MDLPGKVAVVTGGAVRVGREISLAQTRVPLRRPGNARIVTENILHLLSQDFLTGVTIRIDGAEFL